MISGSRTVRFTKVGVTFLLGVLNPSLLRQVAFSSSFEFSFGTLNMEEAERPQNRT